MNMLSRILGVLSLVVISNPAFASNWNQSSATSLKVDDQQLTCDFTEYGGSGYKLSTAKSWIKPSQIHVFKGASATYADRQKWGSALITANDSSKLSWVYTFISKDSKGRKTTSRFKYTFFKTNGKVSASVDFVGFRGINSVWGTCSVGPIGKNSSAPLNYALNSDDLFVDDNGSLSKALAAAKTAKPAGEDYLKELFGGQLNGKYFEKGTHKAVVGAYPLSCNYRYSQWNSENIETAYSKAKAGCELKISKYNDLMNKNCKCRIVALDNTVFVAPKYFHGEAGYVPMIALVDDAGTSIKIKGSVEWDNAGASRNYFRVKNDKNIEICRGHFDVKSKAKGNLTIDCFEGKFKGKGEFVNSGFDEEHRFFNGTALIKLNETSVMRVVYGKEAL